MRSLRLEPEVGGPQEGGPQEGGTVFPPARYALRIALSAGKRRSLASEGLKAGCCCCKTARSESKWQRAAL